MTSIIKQTTRSVLKWFRRKRVNENRFLGTFRGHNTRTIYPCQVVVAVIYNLILCSYIKCFILVIRTVYGTLFTLVKMIEMFISPTH